MAPSGYEMCPPIRIVQTWRAQSPIWTFSDTNDGDETGPALMTDALHQALKTKIVDTNK